MIIINRETKHGVYGKHGEIQVEEFSKWEMHL